MSNITVALRLAACGCRVFPLLRGQKKPAIKRWPDLATTDPAQLRKWWEKMPDANAGIHTAGLLVIDIDGPTGHGHLQQLALPDTITSISGNLLETHRYQLIYRLPPGVRALNKRMNQFVGYKHVEKIDIKSTRGQIVGPGSTHPTGGIYRWKTEPTDLYEQATEAPDWAVHAFCIPEKGPGPTPYIEGHGPHRKRLPEAGGDEELLAVLCARFPVTDSGQRNEQLFRAGAWLAGKRIDGDRIILLLTEWLRVHIAVYATAFNECLGELHSMVYRTEQAVDAGDFLLPPDHEQHTADQELLPELQEWLCQNTSAQMPIHRQSIYHGRCSVISGADGRGRRIGRTLSSEEVRFLVVLLLHYQYKLVQGGSCSALLLTDRQLLEIYEKRWGRRLCWDSFYRLKRKFISRRLDDGSIRGATVTELAVLEDAGVIGTPSLYRVTGLPIPDLCSSPPYWLECSEEAEEDGTVASTI